jgi:hypothetical protein
VEVPDDGARLSNAEIHRPRQSDHDQDHVAHLLAKPGARPAGRGVRYESGVVQPGDPA